MNYDVKEELIKCRENGEITKEKVIRSGLAESLEDVETITMAAINNPMGVDYFLEAFRVLTQRPLIIPSKLPKHEFSVLGFKERSLFKIELWRNVIWIGLFFLIGIELDYNLRNWNFYWI